MHADPAAFKCDADKVYPSFFELSTPPPTVRDPGEPAANLDPSRSALPFPSIPTVPAPPRARRGRGEAAMIARSRPDEVFRGSDAARRLVKAVRELAPGLSSQVEPVAEPTSASPPAYPADAAELAWLEKDGYAILRPERGAAVASAEEISALARGVQALVDSGLPAVSIYATDVIWRVGERVRARIAHMVKQPYVLIDDVWAWSIPPGEGRGWPPHRGTAELQLDRRAPELINVWLALTDVTAERSCMHVVPLDEDPGYPGGLHGVDAQLAAVRALPVARGTALAWNANLLHWGGRCSARSPGPRISCSFSVARPEALGRLGFRAVGAMDDDARVDLVASQIATYGAGKPDVNTHALTWARATCALQARTARLQPRT